jgi:hypothetical protein
MKRLVIGLLIMMVLALFGQSAFVTAGDELPGGSSRLIYLAGDELPGGS